MKRLSICLVLTGSLLAFHGQASLPPSINYQGFLSDINGTPLNGSYDLEFRIYNQPSGEEPAIWTEQHIAVSLTNGVFSVLLGSIIAIPLSVFDQDALWIGVTVGTDSEIAPRLQLTSVPWSFRAAIADSAVVSGSGSGGSGDGHSLDAVDGDPTDAVFVDASGKVGIGSTTPLAELYVKGDQDADMMLDMPSTSPANLIEYRMGVDGEIKAALFYSKANSSLYLRNYSDGEVRLLTNDLTRLNVTADGNVGIGNLTPLARLHVDGGLIVDRSTASHTSVFKNFSTDPNAVAVWAGHENSGHGLYAQTNCDGSTGTAGLFFNLGEGGTGLVAAGNNFPGYTSVYGSGIAATGGVYGVYGISKNTSGARAGAYFSSEGGPYARVAYISSTGSEYKIQGTGVVSSVMATSKGEVSLIAPESPEAWIQDFGEGQLNSGKANIQYEGIFLECIDISSSQSARIFITFTSSPPERYHIEKNSSGFSVVAGGTTNLDATFDYFVSARWKGWENKRFENVEPRPEEVEVFPLSE